MHHSNNYRTAAACNSSFESHLESHEFVVWLWSPGIYLHSVFQGDHQELDPFIFH